MSPDVPLTNEVVQPHDAPDAGVSVSVGPAKTVMIAPEEEFAPSWGMFVFPSVWRLRDGRIVCTVTIGEDELPSDADYHYLWYLSDDEGVHWTHAVMSDEEAETLLRERVTLPSGRQIHYRQKLVSFDAINAPPFQPADVDLVPLYHPRDMDGTVKAYAVEVVYRLGDLREDLRAVEIHTREADQDSWRIERAFMDDDCLLPLFVERVADHAKYAAPTHGLIATPLRRLTTVVGDDRPPVVPVLAHYASEWATPREVRDGFGPERVARLRIPPPTLGRLSCAPVHNYVECPDGSLILPTGGDMTKLASTVRDPARNRAINIFRSRDGGRHWSAYSHIPCVSSREYWLAYPFTITPNMPAGNWLAVVRTCGQSTGNSPLVICRSYDQGLTWTPPVAIRPSSVNPVGGLLANGVAFRMYGRPGQFVTFCADGEGKRWGNDITIAPPRDDPASPAGYGQRSCCNSDVCVLSPDRFLVLYSDYAWDDGHRRRKAILAREIIAKPVS